MTDISITEPYATVAEAHRVIEAAGYVRDNRRALWVKDGKACKVVVRNKKIFIEMAK